MANKPTRIIDKWGRVMIPNHIREALDLAPGNRVDIRLHPDGTIHIRVEEARCAICGKAVEGKEHAELDKGSGRKHVCGDCIALLAREMINKM